MKQRTLKEVAQAGLVLGFEWIAKDTEGKTFLFKTKPNKKRFGFRFIWVDSDFMGSFEEMGIKITDYPHVPENSLLKLSDIVEGE